MTLAIKKLRFSDIYMEILGSLMKAEMSDTCVNAGKVLRTVSVVSCFRMWIFIVFGDEF